MYFNNINVNNHITSSFINTPNLKFSIAVVAAVSAIHFNISSL